MSHQTAQPLNVHMVEQLRARQEALLGTMGSLQLRVDALNQLYNVPFVASDMSAAQFQSLQQRQALLFSQLLGITGTVEHIAQTQNIQLPAQTQVNQALHEVAESLQERQTQSLERLQVLKHAADTIQTLQITPQLQAFLEGAKTTTTLDQREAKAEVKEANEVVEERPRSQYQFQARMYDLELVTDCLRAECQRMDFGKNGTLTKQQMIDLLDKVQMVGVSHSIEKETHFQTLLSEFTADTILDYNRFLDLILDIDSTGTDKMAECEKEWNIFRYNLIGDGRIDGRLRVLYRYDGWPESLSFEVANVDTKGMNHLPWQQILRYMRDNTKDVVQFKEVKCAVNPTFMPGKRGWELLNIENEAKSKPVKVPLLLNNDGTLEVDLWLRTKGFLANKESMPLPEEADDDLMDIE